MTFYKTILLTTFSTLCLLSQLFAQVPEGISYQAVARDGTGAVLANQNIDVKFEIRETAPAGTVIYDETHAVMTNDYGLFTAIIGQGTIGIGVFNTIGWGGDDHFVRVLIDTGSGFVNMGTSQLMSVPYSMMAKRSEKATNMSISELSNVNTGGTSVGQVLKWTGSEWAAANDDTGGGGGMSPWTDNGSSISYSGGNVGIGVASPSHPFHMVHSTTTQNTISVEAGAPPSARDVLEIKVDAATPDGAQFIEMERGTSIVAAVNTDGSARFKEITFGDGTLQQTSGPIAKGHLDITNTTTGAVTVNGSSTLTATYNNTSDYIEVTLTGVTLSASTHLIQVTPIRVNSTSATVDRSASIFFSGGKVRVYVWDASFGGAVANDCYITISDI